MNKKFFIYELKKNFTPKLTWNIIKMCGLQSRFRISSISKANSFIPSLRIKNSLLKLQIWEFKFMDSINIERLRTNRKILISLSLLIQNLFLHSTLGKILFRSVFLRYNPPWLSSPLFSFIEESEAGENIEYTSSKTARIISWEGKVARRFIHFRFQRCNFNGL